MSFPIDDIRQQFPSLNLKYNGNSIVFFDGPSGTQVPQTVIEAIADYFISKNANLGGVYPTSLASEEIIDDARSAIADFLNCNSSEVAFGPNMTTLTYQISRAIARDWKEDDNIVVTELDHRANVDPWLQIAENKHITVNWIRMDVEKYILKLENLDQIINDKTKLIAIGHASNGVGTINNIKKVIQRAKDVGAVVVIDAVHSAPHLSINFQELDIDILVCSAYKFFGPHLGIAIIRKSLFNELKPYKLQPAPQSPPGNLETGTQIHEGIAGTIAAINFIASLGQGKNRKEKIFSAMQEIEIYEHKLVTRIRNKLASIKEITLYQAIDSIPKTPTVAFRINNISPSKVAKYLADNHAIYIGNGHFYAQTIGDLLHLNETGGWLRIGLAPYNTNEEVDRFLHAIQELILAKGRDLI